VRLNIGCGWNYLAGWVNLDSSADSAADRRMMAHDLDFPEASVQEIKALQLIEHLGFFKAKYFLAECWRVLVPGGRLTLETPDIEKTFRAFLDGEFGVLFSASPAARSARPASPSRSDSSTNSRHNSKKRL